MQITQVLLKEEKKSLNSRCFPYLNKKKLMGKGDKLPFIGGEVPLFVAKFHIHQFYTVSGSQQVVIITAAGCTLLRQRHDSRRGEESSSRGLALIISRPLVVL